MHFEFAEVAEINENALDTTHVFIETFFIKQYNAREKKFL